MADSAPYRLPRTAVPRRYEIELATDLGTRRFEGTAAITVDVVEPTARLVLNAADLDVTAASLATLDGSQLAGSVAIDEFEQRVTVSFDRQLAPGPGYRLTLRFGAELGEHLRGLYRSGFNDSAGVHHDIATTQFEPSDARRAFPCWDEPDLKATFAISVVIDDSLTAISNEAPVSEEPLPGGLRRVRFAETMLMSTYLVALVVGPFEFTDPVDVDGVPVRIAAIHDQVHLADYATKAATFSLRFLSQYFEIPYPSSKIDHVAIPDFAFGAMENLGCVTYRENALLADVDEASQLELQRIATVVAHETAHMWFGDLVTMRWWDGIWLNEAFATFMELTTTEAFNPSWQVWATFGAGKAAALATDGLRATRPIEFAVGKPEEAEAMFDVLTYLKGGSVLRMIEQYLGAETFRKGISHYLRSHAHGSTETTDLWEALQEVSGEPVRSMMGTWIGQGGHPVVSAGRGDDPTSIALSQQRFVYSGDPGDQLWGVPVNLRVSVGGQVQRQRLLLDERTATVSFDGPVDWVVVNDGGWGFYRTRYEQDLLGRLCDAGLQSVCDPLERHALLVDTWAAVVAGSAELGEWSSLVSSLGVELDPDVWSAITGACDLLELMGSDEDRAALAGFVRRVAMPAWRELGWEPRAHEAERTRVARGRILGALGLVGQDPRIREEALDRFRRFIARRKEALAKGANAPAGPEAVTGAGGTAVVAPDLVTAVAHIAAAAGGEEAWRVIHEEYRDASNPQDKVRYLYAMTSTPDPALLERCLDLALGEEVRVQDAAFFVATILGRRSGTRLAWEWVVAHWDEVRERWPSSLIARIFEVLPAVVDPGLEDEVRDFVSGHEVPMAGPRVDQVLERMGINVALATRMRSTMAAQLEA